MYNLRGKKFIFSGLFIVGMNSFAGSPRLSWLAREPLKLGAVTAPWQRDPFRVGTPPLHLTGLVSGDAAYINGEWVHEKEFIDNFEVKQVKTKSVILRRGKSEYELHLTE